MERGEGKETFSLFGVFLNICRKIQNLNSLYCITHFQILKYIFPGLSEHSRAGKAYRMKRENPFLMIAKKYLNQLINDFHSIILYIFTIFFTKRYAYIKFTDRIN